MVFSSTVFLFLFLPLVLIVYFVLPKALRNAWILVSSLFFYAWGEKEYSFVMIGSMLNWRIISSASAFGISYSYSCRTSTPGSLLSVMKPLSR